MVYKRVAKQIKNYENQTSLFQPSLFLTIISKNKICHFSNCFWITNQFRPLKFISF